jgi:orotidine-5'-phosphate decarboxylase
MNDDPLYRFGREVIDATTGIAAAYKLNIAFFEAAGTAGLSALRRLVKAIPEPALTIIDAKRGDVGHSSHAYALALYDQLGADVVTVNPYMGYDGIQPFLARRDKGVFVLCRTSNPGASDFQELTFHRGGETLPLYMIVALKVREWNTTHGNCGLVVGATAPVEVSEVRTAAGDLPLLLPGVGAQGGSLEASVTAALGGRFLINVSRGLIPDGSLKRDDWLEEVGKAARGYVEGITAAVRSAEPS